MYSLDISQIYFLLWKKPFDMSIQTLLADWFHGIFKMSSESGLDVWQAQVLKPFKYYLISYYYIYS